MNHRENETAKPHVIVSIGLLPLGLVLLQLLILSELANAVIAAYRCDV